MSQINQLKMKILMIGTSGRRWRISINLCSMTTISSLSHRSFITIIFTAALLLGFYSAHAEMSDWAENEGGRMRLIALPAMTDGTMRAALQIEPKPGWITYWREPGNSGISPQITIAPESGVTLDRIAYPVPKHLSDGTINDLAYDAPVTLPIFLSAKKGTPADLNAKAFIGICKDICIPFQSEFSLKFASAGQSHPEEEAILRAAEATLPEAPSAKFNVKAHSISQDMKHLSLQIILPETADTAPETIVTGPSGHAFTKQLTSKRDGRTFSADIAIGKLPKNYDIHGKSWGVLVIDGPRAMETTLAFE
jgi:DsbC/DsbD-like thiol-disulfide interchange protein